MEHSNKIAIVTGGSQGIGQATVEVLAREGAQVIILDQDEAEGQSLADGLGEQALFIPCDVSKEQQVKEAIARGVAHYGTIHYLVNNAGIQRYAPVTETSEEEWDLLMNVNVKGAFLCAKHAIPHMQRGGQGSGGARVQRAGDGESAERSGLRDLQDGYARTQSQHRDRLRPADSQRGGMSGYGRHAAGPLGLQPVTRPRAGIPGVRRYAPCPPHRPAQ